MTDYVVTANEVVHGPADELIRWLATPALMATWIVGAQSVEALDDRGIAVGATTRLVIGVSRYGQAYSGEIVELSPARLVRRYHLENMKAGVLRLPAGQAEYERIVTYELAPAGPGTAITCTAQTSIPGLAKAAARMGGKAETKSMRRSLERMRTCAEGGQAGAAGRFMDSNYSGQAL